MNLENLKVGMIVKHYKDLCELLDEKVKIGNPKKAQMKQFESHFKFEKMGNSFKIIEIYEVPIRVVDNRDTGNNSLYQINFQILLLDYLARKASEVDNNFQKIELTNQQIISITGMANDLYLERNNDYLLENCNISEFHINDFYRNTGIKFCRIIGSALTNLKNRYILNITDIYKINEQGEWRTADKNEETIIITAKKKALSILNLKTELQVKMKFKTVEFYKIVNEILFIENNWDGCFKCYEVCFFKSELNKDIKHHLKGYEDKKKEQYKLNNKIIGYLNKDTENRYNKNIKEIQALEEKYIYEESNTEIAKELSNKFRYKTCFVEEQKQIIKYLIPI